jgi:hypothetical protein
MKKIETEIQINASPQEVWSILTNLEKYSDWNPFVINASGVVAVGETIEVLICPPEGKQMLFKPTVTEAEENTKFSWLGRLLMPGIFDGEHIFAITATPNGCVLTQNENFSGMLVPLLWKSLNTDTRVGFESMNQALKQRAEALSGVDKS